MKSLLKIFIFAFVLNVFSQEKKQESPFIAIDSLYREDQFYFGITYNSLQKRPPGLVQDGFSLGLNGGFLRDMPINKKRTIAIAAGLGLSYDKFNENLLVYEKNGTPEYTLINKSDYSKNKLETVYLDLPIEFRWRNSTPLTTKFLRWHTGFKVSYLIFSKSKSINQNEEQSTILNNPDLNKLRFGPYLSFGYNTWNAYVYYGLNPIFKSAKLNGQNNDMKNINIGLIFYIL